MTATDTETTETEEPSRAPRRREDWQRNIALARRLCAAGYNKLTMRHFDVWLRSNQGERAYKLRRDYPNEARCDSFFAASTLYKWCEQVEAAIEEARIIKAPPERIEKRRTIPTAQGHDVMEKSDDTAYSRVRTEESTWDYERYYAVGKIDRYSRKRL